MVFRWRIFVQTLAVSAATVAVGVAQDAPRPGNGSQPAAQQRPNGAARPLLQQLNQETQSLYQEVQAGLVRIQLPPPRWAPAAADLEHDDPVAKWGAQLDPAVRTRLQEQGQAARKGQQARITATVQRADADVKNGAHPGSGRSSDGRAPTAPASRPATIGSWTITSSNNGTMVLQPGGAGSGALTFDAGGRIDRQGQIVAGDGALVVGEVAGGSFTPNNIGLVLDRQGHILVPVCVEKEQFEGEPVRVMVGAGQMSAARFVGCDPQANITVLKLDKPLGVPVRAAAVRPTEGALTMFLSPNTGVGRLMVWTNELRDWGVVVSMDGGVHGFARHGQFLSAASCKPCVEQLIASGEVHRVKLGLGLVEVGQADALREGTPELGGRPAVRVSEVASKSAAESAGLKAGDLILTVNGEPVGDPSAFAACATTPGKPLALQLLRGGREQSATIAPPRKK